MSQRVEKAVEAFTPEKCNCSQAVALAFADEAGFDEATAMNAARGFGGGIGRHGLTCGAVTGAVMVLGALATRSASSEKEAKDKAYDMVHQFTDRFTKQHGALACKDLIGLDLSTEAGRQLNADMQVSRKLCPGFVRAAAEIVEDLSH